MVFDTPEFFVFFAIVLGLYYVLNHRWQNILLVASSYFFYGWFDWRFCGLLAFSTVIDWYCGLHIPGPKGRKWLYVSIISQLSLLGFFKYYNFFEENWGDAAYGLLLKEISDSYIDGNYFKRNTSGIYMEVATRIHVTKNTFSNNGWGMKIQASCMDITVDNNNFMQNTFDVGTNGSLVLNKFDKNYWDKYEGYDLNRDNTGDVPYHPVSMYSMIIESNPAALMLFRSLIVSLLDKSEKLLPGITPESLKDEKPLMRPLRL